MGIPFSDTSTTKSGLIQDCEFWTNLGDGTISADTTLLKRFTGLINRAFDEVVPIMFQSDAKWQWDDSNYTEHPIATTDLVSGQPDYTITEDEDGNSILELRKVYIKDPNGNWIQLEPIDAENDPNTTDVFAQNSSNTGTPTRYDKIGTSIWLDPVPNYASTGGVRALFSRSQSYFAHTDTNKKPGIPSPFHRLLSLVASYDWLLVNKPESVVLVAKVEGKIREMKAQLGAHMSKRSRDERPVMRPLVASSR